MSGGSPVGNALANSQQQTPMGGGTSPLNTGGGMSGGQTQMPNFATPNMQRYETNEPFSLAHGPFSSVNSTTQQDMMRGGSGMPFGQRLGQLGFGGQQTTSAPMQNPFQPDPSMVAEEYPAQSYGDMRYRPQRYDPIAAEKNYYARMAQQYQQPQPMRNPFQPIEPSYLQDPEYQGYETQARDLGRQMDEYMKKAPMYQQLQELQGKMSPFQQRHQQQEMQRMQQMQAMQQRQFQQPSPFRRGQFQQPTGIQGLMGMLGGRGGMQQPRMAMDMPQTNQPMETLPAAFSQSFGRERQYSVPAYSANYKNVSRAAVAAQEAAAKAAQEAASPAAPAYEPYYGGGF